MVKDVPENLKPAVNLFNELFERAVLGNLSSGFLNLDNKKNSGVLIAVSGGSDSMGLMNIAKIALPDMYLVAGLVDHGLRDGTFDEWLLVKKEAERLGIKAVRKEISKPELVAPGQKEGLQQWARNKRYALLEEIAKEEGCHVIATGHTEDDQAETVILRILRGAGIDGLGAIPKIRESKTGFTIIRPLINVTRNSIIEWLNSSDIKYATDPSNKNLKFTRVKIRDEILVPLKEINRGVSRHLAELAEESAFLSNFFDDRILNEDGLKKLNLLNGIKVTSNVFNKYPKHFHSRIIRAALKIIKGDLRRIERVHIEAVVKAVDKKTGTSICEVPGNNAIFVSYGELYIFASKPDTTVFNEEPEEKKSKDTIEFNLPGFGVKAVVKKDYPNCKLRFLKADDTAVNSSKKISRILTDKKIPPFYRDIIPCIINEKDKVVSTPINLSDRFISENITWIIAPKSPLKDII